MNFAPSKILLGARAPENVYTVYQPSPADCQTSCKVWLTSVMQRRCSNQGKPWNPLKFAGVPQTRQLILAVSSPYYEDMWRRYCCLTSFLSDYQYTPQLWRYSPTKLCNGVQMANFCILYFQHISDLHCKFAPRPHHVWQYGRHPIIDHWSEVKWVGFNVPLNTL